MERRKHYDENRENKCFFLATFLCAGGLYGCGSKKESQIGEDGVLELEFLIKMGKKIPGQIRLPRH